MSLAVFLSFSALTGLVAGAAEIGAGFAGGVCVADPVGCRRTHTAGWENIDGLRRDFAPVKVVWQAPDDGFTVTKEDGAEGTVEITNGVITVRKTNGSGRIVVAARPFAAKGGKVLRFFADVIASTSPVATGAGGRLCAWTGARRLDPSDRWGDLWFAAGGSHMNKIVNTVPPMAYRKYFHLPMENDGKASVAIVVDGAASESTWRGLAAEDNDAAQEWWEKYRATMSHFDRTGDMCPADALRKALDADTDHTAEIVVRNGFSTLLIDGKPVPPITYKSSGECGSDSRGVIFAGKPVQDYGGVPLAVMSLRLGDLGLKGCEGPWRKSGFDARELADAVDVIINQPDYLKRLPGFSQGIRVPAESFHLHGKLQWCEFDLRTYATLDFWAHSVIAVWGLNTASDLAMWRNVHRKHAGLMNAHRMGWWYYDMADGWYYPREIASDIGEVYAQSRELAAKEPDPWRPDVAFVIDEVAMSTYGKPGGPKVPSRATLCNLQWTKSVASGVPYDSYLVLDFYEHPEIAKKYRAVVWSGFNAPDAKQKALMDQVAAWGIPSFVVQPGGFTPEFLHRFAKEAGAFVTCEPGKIQVEVNGDFLSVHCLVPGAYEILLPFDAKAVNMKDGSVTTGERLQVDLSAGETCWFRLNRR